MRGWQKADGNRIEPDHRGKTSHSSRILRWITEAASSLIELFFYRNKSTIRSSVLARILHEKTAETIA
jgi:hypothetical protein